MDKILLVAFLSSFAGFITAVISIVKLVNEKENKTSEFRQSWTDSVRTTISDLSARLIEMVSGLEYHERLVDIEKKLQRRTGANIEKRLNTVSELLKEVRKTMITSRHNFNQSYALCKLHFKPDDNDFKAIEDIVDSVRKESKSMAAETDTKVRREMRSQNITKSRKIIEIGRQILKNEWERVKEGENVYKQTKVYSFYGGIFMLVMLLILGYFSYLQAINPIGNNIESSSKAELRSDAIKCWQLQNFGERIFELNSCTGELIELKINTTQKEN